MRVLWHVIGVSQELGQCWNRRLKFGEGTEVWRVKLPTDSPICQIKRIWLEIGSKISKIQKIIQKVPVFFRGFHLPQRTQYMGLQPILLEIVAKTLERHKTQSPLDVLSKRKIFMVGFGIAMLLWELRNLVLVWLKITTGEQSSANSSLSDRVYMSLFVRNE